MIDCLRFKRVRWLLHRYVVPGVCVITTALGGCAALAANMSSGAAPSVPSSPPPFSALKGPMASVSIDRTIEVGDLTIAHVTVTSSDPRATVMVSQAYAVSQSGGKIERLDVDRAIEKAGGADKLLAAVHPAVHPEVEVAQAEGAQSRKANFLEGLGEVLFGTAAGPFAIFFIPFLLAAGATHLAVEAARGCYSDRAKILKQKLPVWVGESEGCGDDVGNYDENYYEFHLNDVGDKMSGYLFFPRGNYIALELKSAEVLRDVESDALEKNGTIRCPWRETPGQPAAH